MENEKDQVLVLVLGAGVIGLQTAYHLLKAGLGVTIVAKHWPGDKDIEYTSPWAGAQWRSNVDLNDLKQQEWDRQTFAYWIELVKEYPPEVCGLELRPAALYWDNPTPTAMSPETNIWWSSLVPSFQKLLPSNLPPNTGFVAGITYQTFCLSPTLYLQHLLSLCIKLGARQCKAEISSLEDVFQLPSCGNALGLVNSPGLSAGKLVPDEAMYPTKGQTILVKGKAERIGVRSGDGWEALVVPRPGSDETLLGGCKLVGDWSTHIDAGITETILERCRPLAPDLLDANGKFEILSLQIGHRPSRRGGPRVELEWIKTVNGRKKFICHNYGHSSAGYESSVGTANDAVGLVLSSLYRKDHGFSI